MYLISKYIKTNMYISGNAGPPLVHIYIYIVFILKVIFNYFN